LPAQAQKQSQILAAEGEARSIELRTAAEAQGIRVRGDALEENGRVIDLTLAQWWSGHPPQTTLGEHGAAPFFNVGANTDIASQSAQPSR
jgi:regulator of protease activity HflC (stomatin/prohibitin superfamily)